MTFCKSSVSTLHHKQIRCLIGSETPLWGRLSVRWPVCRLVGSSVIIFLKGREVSLTMLPMKHLFRYALPKLFFSLFFYSLTIVWTICSKKGILFVNIYMIHRRFISHSSAILQINKEWIHLDLQFIHLLEVSYKLVPPLQLFLVINV